MIDESGQPRRILQCLFRAILLAALGVGFFADGQACAKTKLHYASEGNFKGDAFTPGEVGMNLADINEASSLKYLPNGVRALVWVGQCNGVDADFLARVQPFVNQTSVFGFYLTDEPDPEGRWGHSLCLPKNLAAEAAWIHNHMPAARTFITIMTLSTDTPSYFPGYATQYTGIDYFGVNPYPCTKSELKSEPKCDMGLIRKSVEGAIKAGYQRQQLVPVYQTFGEGIWHNGAGHLYSLPEVSKMNEILEVWDRELPCPPFDFAYTWGSQKSARSMSGDPKLRALFQKRNFDESTNSSC